MHIFMKRKIMKRNVDDEVKTKSRKTGKVPPQYVNKGNFQLKMKPSIHTIVACITAMMVVFHIIICLSVWQQCKSHNRPIALGALPVEAATPRSRPRNNGEQSFSELAEEPPLIGEVPLPPEYKEENTSKPPSYHNIAAPNSDHTRAV